MPENRNIKAVLFDMDGVLIDARDWHYHALNEALRPFGFEISYEDHLSRFNGLSTGAKLNILSAEYGFPQSLHPLVNEVKQDRTLRIAGQFCYPVVQHQILVARLRKKGFATGVVTNSIRRTAEILLSHAQLLDLIDVLVTNQDVQNQKPSPDCYLLACTKLGLSPEEVIVIEDGDYGYEAAKSAGCHVIKVDSPLQVSLELLADELPQLLVGIN
jgi:HAD superfamily hydrolase (TIGR01509 family)